MGFGKDDQWPFLIIDSSTELLDTGEIQGKDSIVEYFVARDLIQDVKTHSAYEKQGIEWVVDRAIPAYDLLKSNLRGKYQYYFVSKGMAYRKPTIEAGTIVREALWKFYKPLHYHVMDYRIRKTLREEIKNRFQIFHDTIDEWEARLDGNRFHGGNLPDAADFKMYSLAFAHNHMFSVKKLLKSRGDREPKFNNWFVSMQDC